MTVRVFQVPSAKHYTGRAGQAVIALVHHRMVGTLAGTDITFTTGTRQASTNFGVGYDCGKIGHPKTPAGAHVHQYVAVDDAAWGNGNLDVSGQWDDLYGASPNPNYRTISIEHHDNGGAALGSGRGVVIEEVIAQSIELDQLLLSGDWLAWKAAGIRANTDAGGAAVSAQVQRIVPTPRTIVDHNFIAGKLKPYCWKPWSDDRIGFPQARYIAALTEETDVPTLTGYIPGQVAVVKATANIRSAPQLATATKIRAVLVGSTETWVVTGWVKGDIDPDGGSDQWLCRWAGGRWEYTAKSNITSLAPAVADCTAAEAAARSGGRVEGYTSGRTDGTSDERTRIRNVLGI